MTPDRKIWLAEQTARNLTNRLSWARTNTAGRVRHMEVARDMLRVLTERINAAGQP